MWDDGAEEYIHPIASAEELVRTGIGASLVSSIEVTLDLAVAQA